MSANAREITSSRASHEDDSDIHRAGVMEHYSVQPKGSSHDSSVGESAGEARHGAVELVDSDPSNGGDGRAPAGTVAAIEASKPGRFSFLRTKQFYIVLLISQALAVAITGTNTLSSLLANEGTSIPAFQTLFNYILLTLIYTSYTLYKYGFKGWCKLIWKDGWRYFILAFCDVEGNYFTVLAYFYTNILSAQLINFWAIVVVVVLSFFFLKVRYRPFQIVGILVCCGGMGILIGSDFIRDSNNYEPLDKLKGDLFALLGATCYGVTNTFEEFLVSKRPVHEVLSFMALFGMCILGVQAAIFDRAAFQEANFDGPVIGYIIGFTLCLSLFYSLVPLVLRLASAAFYNISLLTGNFWGVIIGIHVFKLAVHFLYPVAFVLIVLGLIIYFLAGSMLGDSKKPWLGENQEQGVAGYGTAKRKAIDQALKRRADPEAAGVRA